MDVIEIIKVKLPPFAIPESKYSLEILLATILGLKYEVTIHEQPNVTFCIGDKFCSFDFHFFKHDQVNELYHKDLIPSSSIECEYTIDDQLFTLHQIYGGNKVRRSPEGTNFDFDIIGSSFFMLSRWEEKIIKSRDSHDRFDASKALAVKSNFIGDPVVNQYALFLYAQLKSMGLTVNRRLNNPTIEMSHDIDFITKWKSIRSLFGGLSKAPRQSSSIIRSYIKSKADKRNDPFYSFRFLIDEYSNRSLKACFYFKTNLINIEHDKTDYKIDEPAILEIISLLKKNGHDIGLHSSYQSFLIKETMQAEKIRLEKACKHRIDRIRQDFLRIDLPKSMAIFNALGFLEDSSISYGHYPGFRNGICNRFQLFDFEQRKKINLIQLPLICMMSMVRNKNLSEIRDEFIHFIGVIKKHEGTASLLWHNNDLDSDLKKATFTTILDEISKPS